MCEEAVLGMSAAGRFGNESRGNKTIMLRNTNGNNAREQYPAGNSTRSFHQRLNRSAGRGRHGTPSGATNRTRYMSTIAGRQQV